MKLTVLIFSLMIFIQVKSDVRADEKSEIKYTEFSFEVKLKDQVNKKVIVRFNDKVKKIIEVKDGIEVYFELYAAIYTLKKDHPHFNEMKTKLLEYKKLHKAVEVETSISGPEIEKLK